MSMEKISFIVYIGCSCSTTECTEILNNNIMIVNKLKLEVIRSQIIN